jgi:peptide chain release factor subunit 1
MSAATKTARRLLEQTGEHPVVSLIFDLDPERFSTPPARATQLRSLIDEAHRASRSDTSWGHADRQAVKGDIARLEEYMDSGDPPISGARALAVYTSTPQDLFEAVPLSHPAAARIVIARRPYVEPLVVGEPGERWAVVLISRRHGRIFEGAAVDLRGEETITDRVHGRHSRGGWSQANYERSVADEAEHHLRHVAGELYRRWQQQPFTRLVLGGPVEDVNRFAELLHNDLRPTLVEERLSLDVETARPADVQEAAGRLLEREQTGEQAEALAHLEERLAAGGTAVLGLDATLMALGERRVERLVLDHNFAARGTRCPQCGLLYPEATAACPADGTSLEAVEDVREAAVEAAILQDAAITVVGEGSDPPPPPLLRGGGIGALLRF